MKDKPTSKFKVLRFWINLFLSSLVYMGNSEINYVGNYVGLEIVHLGMDNLHTGQLSCHFFPDK